jgi:hypothetical protein
MTDANVRIPEEAKDRLAAIAAAEGLSLRAYLARMAQTLLTPAERAERAEKARAALKAWNGYVPTADQERDLVPARNRRKKSDFAGNVPYFVFIPQFLGRDFDKKSADRFVEPPARDALDLDRLA